MKRKTVKVTRGALQAAGRKSTEASARLEGREVPAGFVRSPAVERYIAECGSRTTDSHELAPETHPTVGEMEQPGRGVAAD